MNRCVLWAALAAVTAPLPVAAEAGKTPGVVRVTVEAAGIERNDLVVDVPLDTGVAPAGPASVVEYNESGDVVDDDVPAQYDEDTAELSILLDGRTGPEQTRHYGVRFAAEESSESAKPLVEVSELEEYQGQAAWKIVTPNATYVYHRKGAGFASLIDADGRDWISYRPKGGSAGNYRGIPNLVHPGGYFHPGGEKCTSKLVAAGPLKAVIVSEAEGGKWRVRWDIYPTHAKLTVLAAAKPYWFLYEGTPGGKIDYDTDYCVRSGGTRTPAGRKWDEKLPTPGWVYFGDAELERALFLYNHDADRKRDSYWPMQRNMTVFGFGRLGLKKSMTHTPACFTVGLAEAGEEGSVEAAMQAVCRPLSVRVGGDDSGDA